MTRNTNRYNIKPMLFCVAGMVIVVRLFATGAFECVWFRDVSGSDSIVDIGLRLQLLCVLLSILLSSGFDSFSFAIAFLRRFSFFAVIVRLTTRFAFLAFSIATARYLSATSAFFLESVFLGSVLVKFRNGFNFLASAALLWYDGFGHVLFLNKRISSGPVAAQTATGSFYYTPSRVVVNGK